ncbi:hypothetical protein CEXT_519281 [Caerostris extrusa]|uniref:Uncharacterized protein n=1 Tax=Caerostris extrusa TaxID=172846 RepID=A0AAV4TI01_CAEEX|nr:hypothetical protein CEXT_519281 [Caerostris extrusa]
MLSDNRGKVMSFLMLHGGRGHVLKILQTNKNFFETLIFPEIMTYELLEAITLWFVINWEDFSEGPGPRALRE